MYLRINILQKSLVCAMGVKGRCCVVLARPDFTELDVFLGQHILLTLEQHFNSKM